MLKISKVNAHCDLFCGVYDPAQARIEAQAVLNAVHKYNEEDDPVFKQRAVLIKEERAQLVKEHLWVLWTDYFKPPHLKNFPEIHELIWQATKAAGEAKKSIKEEDAQKLVDLVDKVGKIFEKTKPGYSYDAVVKNLTV